MVSRKWIRRLQILFWIFLSAILCTGFRSFGGVEFWDISKVSAAESKLYVVYTLGTTALENDLPASDPLGSAGTTVTIDQLMTTVFDDFNSIQAAFVTLVASSDSDFASLGSRRTITIENAAASGVSSGEASTDTEDGVIVGCKIALTDRVYETAKGFLRTVTHEIGHCLGLDHPQDTVNSVMSYFANRDDVFRLQIDDKMGITHMYPVEEKYGDETPTFGLSCARK